jgi:hypothetical protein
MRLSVKLLNLGIANLIELRVGSLYSSLEMELVR